MNFRRRLKKCKFLNVGIVPFNEAIDHVFIG